MYVRAGMLEPLPEDIISLFKTTVAFDGKTYTAPLSGENTQGIIYNKKYFDDNGFTELKTYDEFMELCQKIKDKGVIWRLWLLADRISGIWVSGFYKGI